ncbi:MAG: hypothetical protein R6W82_05955 [bacterium]
MHRYRSEVLLPFLLVLAVLLQPPEAAAQESSSSVGVEVLKPSIDDTKMFNGAVFLTYTRMLTRSHALDVSLPLARSHKDSPLLEEEVLVGNPYVGGVRTSKDSPIFYTAGLRLPITSGEKPFARLMGEYTDLTRAGAFLPRTLVLEGTIGYGGVLDNGIQYWGSAGPLFTFPFGEDEDAESFLRFSASALYEVMEGLQAGAGLSGIYGITTDSLPYDGLVLQAVAGLEYDLGAVRPGITARLPLSSDWGDAVDGILGLHLAVPLS